MPNFSKIFQEEVRRLAKKEVNAAFPKVQKTNTDLRKTIADLKRRVEALERANRKLRRQVEIPEAEPQEEAASESDRLRISSTTIRNLRRRLGLTQAEFAKLIGVTGQSVYQWERRDGRLQLRIATRQAVAEAKLMGAREARQRLESN